MTSMRQALFRYLALLLVQTICALVILSYILEVLRVLIDNIGVRQAVPAAIMAQVAIAAAIAQACYWTRLYGVPIPDGYRNVVLGHLLAFASRLSFIFGGALFSFYFVRHLPAMETATLDIGFAFRAASLIAVLFVLYCYSLELERLGAAFQAREAAAPARASRVS